MWSMLSRVKHARFSGHLRLVQVDGKALKALVPWTLASRCVTLGNRRFNRWGSNEPQIANRIMVILIKGRHLFAGCAFKILRPSLSDLTLILSFDGVSRRGGCLAHHP